METVAPGIYVETGYASGNVGAIVTGAGVVCVDVPERPSHAHRWFAQIRSVTDEAIIALIKLDTITIVSTKLTVIVSKAGIVGTFCIILLLV